MKRDSDCVIGFMDREMDLIMDVCHGDWKLSLYPKRESD